MINYFDLRGSQRLSLLCNFVHEVFIMILINAMVTAITRTMAVMGTIEFTNMIVFYRAVLIAPQSKGYHPYHPLRHFAPKPHKAI